MRQSVGRRAFLGGSLAAGLAALQNVAAGDEAAEGSADVYELRLYSMKSAEMRQRADGYFEKALLPALGRAGTGPVGAFTETKKPEASPIYILIPFKSMQAVAELGDVLENDQEYKTAGAEFLGASPKDPGYGNLETRIMIAPQFMPKLKVPEKTDTRLFELRRYRNPSEPAFHKKVEMFAKGELALFHKAGMVPVFFSGMLAGPDMPNVTYMLAYADAQTHDKVWGAFGGDPEWKKLSHTPGYTDPEIIADIKSTMLKPTAYSQI